MCPPGRTRPVGLSLSPQARRALSDPQVTTGPRLSEMPKFVFLAWPSLERAGTGVTMRQTEIADFGFIFFPCKVAVPERYSFW